MSNAGSVAILGIFVADLAFRSGRMPAVGETIMGSGFAMGPGGKGSNQAVASSRAGAKRLLSRGSVPMPLVISQWLLGRRKASFRWCRVRRISQRVRPSFM